MKHPNKRVLVCIKAIEWFKKLYPENLVLTNLFNLDFLSNHQGIIIVLKQVKKHEDGNAEHLEFLTKSKAEFKKFCEVLGVVLITSTLYALKPVKKLKEVNWNWKKIMKSFCSTAVIHNSIGLDINDFTLSGVRNYGKIREWLLCEEEPNDLIRARLNELLSLGYQDPK